MDIGFAVLLVCTLAVLAFVIWLDRRNGGDGGFGH